MKNLLKCAIGLALASTASFVLAADTAKAPAPVYDVATVVDITAKIADVREVPKGNALDGLHLILQAGAETIDVYVGPVEFVKVFDVTFTKGEEVHVIGSKVNFENATVVLARELSIGTVTILCRDKEGQPLWKFFLRPPVG